MSIMKTNIDELRRMYGKEALILQGCGEPFADWLDGINDEFTKENILLEGSKFKDISVFNHNNITCILFPFDNSVKLDLGKLSIWRVRTHEVFGGTWLSDYVDNKLGGFVKTSLTTGQAVQLSKSGWYEGRNAKEIAAMQLFEPKLIVPTYSIFRNAVSEALGVPEQTLEFGFGKENLQRLFIEKVENAAGLMEKMEQEKQAFLRLADHDAIYFHNEKLKGIIGDMRESDIYYSGDFQCDQTDGYPTMLCACWEKEIAWLEPNTRIADENINIHHINELCANFGIKKCIDAEQFNNILKDLGKDAYESACIPTESEGQVQSL